MSDSPSLIPVPGGHARLRDPSELTARHTRAYQTLVMAFGAEKFAELIRSQAVKEAAEGLNDEAAFLAAVEECRLDLRQAELLSQMSDALVFKWVQEVKVQGLRTPGSVDQVQDLPDPVLDALVQATGKREAEHRATTSGDEFSVGAAGDPDSPSGDSLA